MNPEESKDSKLDPNDGNHCSCTLDESSTSSNSERVNGMPETDDNNTICIPTTIGSIDENDINTSTLVRSSSVSKRRTVADESCGEQQQKHDLNQKQHQQKSRQRHRLDDNETDDEQQQQQQYEMTTTVTPSNSFPLTPAGTGSSLSSGVENTPQDYSTFAWTKAMANNSYNRTWKERPGTRSNTSNPMVTPANTHPFSFMNKSRIINASNRRNNNTDDLSGVSSESSSLLLFASHDNKKNHQYLQSPFLFDTGKNHTDSHNYYTSPARIGGGSGGGGRSSSSFFMRLDQYSDHTYNNDVITIASLDAAIQKRLRQQKFKQRIRRSALVGAFIGGLFALILIIVFPEFPDLFLDLWDDLRGYNHHDKHQKYMSKSVEATKTVSTPIQQKNSIQKQPEQQGEVSEATVLDKPTITKTPCTEEPCQSILPLLPEKQSQQPQLLQQNADSANEIEAYFDLFYPSRWFQQQHKQLPPAHGSTFEDRNKRRQGRQRRRRTLSLSQIETGASTVLSSGSTSSSKASSNSNNSPLLVIAGKMSVEGAPCNIAQYNLKTGEWSLDERIQLSLYNSYSGGEVYSLLANYSYITSPTTASSNNRSSNPKKQIGSGELIVVGAFDTTYRNSQVTYCSVGMWDGSQLKKVGEGLCNSALSKGMKITTASLAGPQDVYVAGSFQTQVWNGDRHEFVKIFNIAHFNAVDQVWLPLNVGQISCSWCTVTVLALAWDSKRRQLHVAGKFNSIDGRNVPAGLAVYDYDSGHLVAHPGGGLSMKNISQDGVGTALQLDEESGVLYVMGSFERLTQTYERCDGLAAYEIEASRWTCLADAAHTVYPTGGGNMLLTPFGLMVAGKTTPTTTWRNPDRPYTIALLKTTLKTRNPSTTANSKSNAVNSTKQNATLLDDNGEQEQQYHDFNWSWLPGFKGHDEPLHALTNGFGSYEGSVFIAGDNLVARWSYQPANKISEEGEGYDENEESSSTRPPAKTAKNMTTNVPSSDLDTFVRSNDTEGEDVSVFGELNFADETVKNITFTDTTVANITDASNAGDEMSINSFFDQTIGNYTDTNVDETLLQPEGQQRNRRLVTDNKSTGASSSAQTPKLIPVTEFFSLDNNVRGAIMAISQMMPNEQDEEDDNGTIPIGPNANSVNITIIVYCVSAGCIIGVIGAIVCNRNLSGAIFPPFQSNQEKDFKGFSLDTLTYSAMENTSIMDAYQRAMKTRYVHHPNLLTIIDPQEIFLQRIIGEGTFGRVWSARWRTASVAVKEFVFAQAAVAGKSSQQQQIVEEIIGEAGMMAILRHPNVLQLFGCSLTAQAIWIVSELCSLGSLRQLLDDNDRVLPVGLRLSLALQVAEGMTYLHNQVPPIIHRDLKSHNIFVHETFTDAKGEDGNSSSNKDKRKDGSERMETQSTIIAKIGDWGSARATLSGSRTMTHGVGTACWLAPEVIKHARSSKFSDVYGYGIVLWELATREEVYQGLETTQIIAKVANENLRPPVPKDCPWKDIMVKCWAENPQDRLEFEEIDAQLNDLSKRLQESTSSSGLTGGGNVSVS